MQGHGCYEHRCSNQTLEVAVDGVWQTCPIGGGPIQFNGFNGDLVCPPYNELCGSTVPYIPGACPHACNLNGECINGECHCFLGFSGEYCNQRKCVHLWLPSISHLERVTIWGIRFLCVCWQLCFCIVSSCVAWVLHEKLVISSCEPFNSVTSEIFWSCLIWPEYEYFFAWDSTSFWRLIGSGYRCLSQWVQWSWHLHG